MNVIISNKYKQELDNLEIDVSKKVDGELSVEELIEQFSNYFFNKMIIDITAIKDYQNFNSLQKLSMNLNVEKIIFLLDRDNVNPHFLSQLVSIGIYNFTTTIEGVMYLYNNPNSYRDVAQYQNPNSAVERSEFEHKFNRETKNILQAKPNIDENQRIIGIKNVTDNAGATTLTYIMKNELSNYRDVVAIEVNKKDFLFLRDSELISIEAKNLYDTISKYSNKDIILIDLNSFSDYSICTDILYLIEPTSIKLNKMIMLDRKIFDKLQGKKIILNKSMLERKDISSFELESTSSVYYNIPNLDEKKDNQEYLLPLFEKMGLLDDYNNNSDDKFLGVFNI